MDRKVKIGLAAVFIMQAIIIWMISAYMQTRPMLDARAFTQEQTLIVNWDKFTPAAKKRMLDHWEAAEYSAEGKRYLLSITPPERFDGEAK